jgi:hypothetical protein
MNCSLCKLKEIVINSTTTQVRNVARCHNDNYYCEECYEAIEFAGDMSSKSKKDIIIKEQENFKDI